GVADDHCPLDLLRTILQPRKDIFEPIRRYDFTSTRLEVERSVKLTTRPPLPSLDVAWLRT
ncbi:hypothetical protein, partial [Bradyrhizobium sp. Mp27]|uniref:hypothetical protein n=1 Tax=Bradyrhizobium sp. Mp27 TaxID=3042157 RepID=UPI00248B0E3F